MCKSCLNSNATVEGYSKTQKICMKCDAEREEALGGKEIRAKRVIAGRGGMEEIELSNQRCLVESCVS